MKNFLLSLTTTAAALAAPAAFAFDHTHAGLDEVLETYVKGGLG